MRSGVGAWNSMRPMDIKTLLTVFGFIAIGVWTLVKA